MGGHDPYSSSKGCAELVAAAYRASYWSQDARVHMGSARAGNVIGGGDWAKDRLLPDLLAALGRGESALVRNPDSVRPWQHVLEPLSGYLSLAERLWSDGAGFADGWNFGPAAEDVQSVRWIADFLTATWGGDACWHTTGGPQLHEARLLMLDSAKARQLLSWQPRWHLAQALRQTVDWQQAFLRGEPMRTVTLSQIHAYTAAGPHQAAP